MAEFDPEAYLEQKLEGGQGAPNIPPPPPLPANGAEQATADDERPSRRESDRSRRRSSRSRSREKRSSRRSRSREGGRSGRDRGHNRDRSRERERKPRYDESYSGPPHSRGDRDHGKSSAQKEEEGFERDLRTVFVAQVARKADERDLFAFFCDCGKVTDVRIIKDTQTRRSKGIAYVEFEKQENCMLAVAKSGQIICGFPVVIQASQAEKNIAAKQAAIGAQEMQERPSRIQVSNLHKDIGHDDLQALFSPFGQVLSATIDRQPGPTNMGTVTFKQLAEAQKAVVHLNNFDLAGNPLVVQLVQEQPRPMQMMGMTMGPAAEMLDDHETGGVQVTAQSRAALMAKLARGQELGMGGPQMGYPPPMGMAPLPPPPMAPAPPAPGMGGMGHGMGNLPPNQAMPSEYMLLVNMFDPAKETEPNWHLDIQDDVQAECTKFGMVQRCVCDRNSPQGLVYLKFDNSQSAQRAAQALNGRFFAGKAIAALFLNGGIWEKFCPRN